MSRLQRLERDFQGHVYALDTGMEAQVAGTAKATAEQRLDIYADAYRLRLLEVLGDDFIGLKLMVGEEKFERLAREYIESQTSAHFNVRWYGEGLQHFLRASASWRDEAALAEMATFEWAMGLAFDAPDEPVAAVSDVAAVPPESWPGMTAIPQSGLQHLQLSWNVPDIRKTADQNSEAPALAKLDSACGWLIWRQDLTVYYRRMEEAEDWAVTALRDHATFAEICEGLCQWFAPEEVPAQAAGLLKRWVTDGLICEVRYSATPDQ